MDIDQTIRAMLAKNGGNAKKAEQAIRMLAERDPAFLLQLATPHLAGIIGHALARAQKASVQKTATTQQAMTKPAAAAPKKSAPGIGLNGLLDRLAQNINADGNKPKEVSQQHKDALHALAKKKN